MREVGEAHFVTIMREVVDGAFVEGALELEVTKEQCLPGIYSIIWP